MGGPSGRPRQRSPPRRPAQDQLRGDVPVPVSVQDVQHLDAAAGRRAVDGRDPAVRPHHVRRVVARRDRRRDLPAPRHRRAARGLRRLVAATRAPALPHQRLPDRSHCPRVRTAGGTARAADRRHRQPRRRRDAQRRGARHQGRVPAADRDVPRAAPAARHPSRVRHDAVGLQRRPLRGDVPGVPARLSRSRHRRFPSQRRPAVAALLRQRRRRRRAAVAARRRPRAARLPQHAPVPAYARRLARSGVPAPPRDVRRDGPAADAVPLAAIELLHRSLRHGVSLHHVHAAARQPARNRYEPGPHLEGRRDGAGAVGDLGGPLSAVLDGV